MDDASPVNEHKTTSILIAMIHVQSMMCNMQTTKHTTQNYDAYYT